MREGAPDRYLRVGLYVAPRSRRGWVAWALRWLAQLIDRQQSATLEILSDWPDIDDTAISSAMFAGLDATTASLVEWFKADTLDTEFEANAVKHTVD